MHIFEVLARRAGRLDGASPGNEKNLNFIILKLDYNYEDIFENFARRAGRPHGASPSNEIFWKFRKLLNLLMLKLD